VVVYFLSGLGADERAFQKLLLPGDWTIIHIQWLPFSKDETLLSYTHKLAKGINPNQPFALVGLSFGGIVATELSKLLDPKITIIISSISIKKELPISYKLIGLTGINKLVPSFFLNKVYPFTYWYFGMKTKSEKRLLKQIIKDTSPQFLKWAINEILNWKNEDKPSTIFHIHGNRDRIFPIQNIKADIVVEGGGHFMVYNKADSISKLLIEKISS
jgi:pimeloyl-ACP methyl ester carboxylesterase